MSVLYTVEEALRGQSVPQSDVIEFAVYTLNTNLLVFNVHWLAALPYIYICLLLPLPSTSVYSSLSPTASCDDEPTCELLLLLSQRQ